MISDEPLNICYNRLFGLDLRKDCYIHDRWYPDGWIWNWRRPIKKGHISAIFSSMLGELKNVTLTDNLDSWFWQTRKDGVYTAGDTRRHIDDHILAYIDVPTIWNKRLPRKVKETSSHYFFTCDLASLIWRAIRIWCDISTPLLLSCADWITWIESLQGSKQKKIHLYVIVATSCWIL
ncbi:hypothetical protein Tco_1459446 [Tanacetum coccineum]